MRRMLVGLAIAGIAFLSPLAALADDDLIAQQIFAKLQGHQRRGELKGFDIKLVVQDGAVVLKGRVANEGQEQLALAAAKGIEGVTTVGNDLQVADKKPFKNVSTTASKTTPAAKKSSPISNLGGVSNAMHRTPAAKATLTPAAKTTRTPVAETKAIPVAAKAASTAPATISDETILRSVASVLREKKQAGVLKHFNVNVRVAGGTLWIKGNVASDEQQALALDLCRHVRGVVQVVNELQVTRPVPVQAVALQRQPQPAPIQQAQAAPIRHAQAVPQYQVPQQPLAFARSTAQGQAPAAMSPQTHHSTFGGMQQVRYDQPNVPNYAWPSYAASPNYGAVAYPKQYSPSAWPYIGPFYPYPQVPLGWRSVTLEWDDGWWFLNFRSRRHFRHR